MAGDRVPQVAPLSCGDPGGRAALSVPCLVEAGLQGLPEPARAVLSMLSYEERGLLFELGRRFKGMGLVVDAGCFVGGSTVSLAAGLAVNDRSSPGVIHTYDLLRSDPDQTGGYSDAIDALPPGSSLRDLFEQNVAPYRDLITLHEGDILLQRPPDDQVEILFIDICKTWKINFHVVKEFFAALLPDHSIVIQQDLVHWRYPWCAIVMEALQAHFEYLGWTWYASSAWRCRSRPSDSELATDWKRDVGLPEGLALLRQSARRHGGWAVPLLELCRASLLYEFGEYEASAAEIDRVEAEYGHDVPHIEQGYATLRSLVRQAG